MRPHEHEQPTARHLYCAYLIATTIGIVVVSIAITVILLALVGSVRAENPVCQTITDWAFQYQVEYPRWIGYPDGWEGIPPETFEQAEMLILPFPDESGGYVLYRLTDGSDVIVPHWSWERRADSEELHFGTHDLCPVMRWLTP